MLGKSYNLLYFLIFLFIEKYFIQKQKHHLSSDYTKNKPLESRELNSPVNAYLLDMAVC